MKKYLYASVVILLFISSISICIGMIYFISALLSDIVHIDRYIEAGKFLIILGGGMLILALILDFIHENL